MRIKEELTPPLTEDVHLLRDARFRIVWLIRYSIDTKYRGRFRGMSDFAFRLIKAAREGRAVARGEPVAHRVFVPKPTKESEIVTVQSMWEPSWDPLWEQSGEDLSIPAFLRRQKTDPEE